MGYGDEPLMMILTANSPLTTVNAQMNVVFGGDGEAPAS